MSHEICYLQAQEKFEDTKGESEAVNRRTDNTTAKRNREKRQTMSYKILHRKLKIEQQESHKKQEVNSGAP